MNRVLIIFLLYLPMVSVSANGQFRSRFVPDTSTSKEIAVTPTREDPALKSQSIKRRVSCAATVREDLTYTGRITGESGRPLSFASVKVIETEAGTVADSMGNYTLSLPWYIRPKLEFSYVGYQTMSIEAKMETNDVVLDLIDSLYSSIEIQCERWIPCRIHCGIQCRTSICGIMINRKTPAADSFTNVIASVTVFPNPAPKGATISIRTTGFESPSFQLVDNYAKPIQGMNAGFTAKTSAHQLSLPAYLAAGIYYVVVTDSKTKKQYTRKLIIQ